MKVIKKKSKTFISVGIRPIVKLLRSGDFSQKVKNIKKC